MKKLFLSTLLLALPLLASAYDCQVDGIYYNLKPGNQAEVTQVNDYVEANPSNYSGAVVIPEKFNYKGVMYTVTSIGEYAFYDCWNLVSVTIPNSVIIIETGAFNGCSGLTSVTIPNSVTSIGDYAFSYCTGLTSVTIPNSVTSISNSAFESCSRLTSVTIPNSVTSIGDYAFSYCTDMTSVTIPNSVTTIGEYAFCSCIGLTSVHITDIAAWCKISFGSNPLENACHLFLNGEEIKDLVIPNSVTAIEAYAFSYSTGLTSVISKMENPCHINDDCFPTDVFYNATLYVPEGTVDKYKSTDYWNKFVYTEESDPTDIIQVSSDDLLISAQNGTITVRGEQDGLPLTVYSADGKLLGSATTKDGQASISTNLQRGEIAIVKVGSKSVKIKM